MSAKVLLRWLALTQITSCQLALATQPGEGIVTDSSGNYVVTYCAPSGSSTCQLEQVVWVPSTKIKPSIRTMLSNVDGTVHYSYAVSNDETSSQAIALFAIDSVSNLTGGPSPLSISPSISDDALTAAVASWRAALSAPTGWQPLAVTSQSGNSLRVAWMYASPATAGGLLPGKTERRFALASNDLPGIGIAEVVGNPGNEPVFSDDGPTGNIGQQFSLLQRKNFLGRYVALPTISVPSPFSRTLLLQSIDGQVATWVNYGLIDGDLYSRIHTLIQAAIASANAGDNGSCKLRGDALRKLLRSVASWLDNQDQPAEAEKSGPIAPLAARVLDFDIEYVMSHQ
jgi:hypothetical protein